VVLPQQLATAQRGFHCSDASLKYPYRQPWLTKVHLTIAVVALPAAFVLVVEMLRAAVVPSSTELKPVRPDLSQLRLRALSQLPDSISKL